MRHIVLGSEGFIGKYLVNFLKNQNKTVIEFDIKNSLDQDCCTVSLCLNKEDIVYFLAWDVGGAKYLYRQDTQKNQIHCNLALMNNVFKQLESTGCQFIFISSQLAGTDSAYGILKRLGELLTAQLGGQCLRLWNVYGAYESYSERSHVISDFIYQAINNKCIKLLTTGEEKRQFIYIDDVCSAIQNILENEYSEVYDITSFEWVKIVDIAGIIANIFNIKLVLGNKVGETQYVLTKGKLPNWNPKMLLTQGLKETIKRYEL